MMKKLATFIFSICLAYNAIAAGGEYAISLIPVDLLKNANAVKRIDEQQFALKNAGEAIFRHRYAYTILNENGDRFAQFGTFYNNFFEIRSIEGTLYDAAGKEIKKLKSKDIQDMSGVDEISLMDDNRYKVHNFYYKVYPYTIEYEMEVKYKGTMFFPDWHPLYNSLVSVQESIFSVSCPENYGLRYKANHYDKPPVVTIEKGIRTYQWKSGQLPAMVKEPYSPGLYQLTPSVKIGPAEFEMGKYKGNMNSWESFGKFIDELRKGRDELPDKIKNEVHQLTDQLTDPEKKVKVLYEFLQKNTRYISVQLGIGSWQPFDAAFVASKRYGDCKALSNYMCALLKEAGVPSNYVLINAGEDEEDIEPGFPNSAFNHAILCVPLAKDTIWLECTSQVRAAGYMGAFTGNRYALMITDKGGQLVRTPAYGVKDNFETRKINATLEENGTLKLEVNTSYGSLQQDNINHLINEYSKDKVKEYLHDKLDFATYEINNFQYKEQKSALPVIDEALTITVSNYATITGKRLFILPNIMTRDGRRLATTEARKYDVVLASAYRDVDTVEIQLPKGYEPEAIPKNNLIDSKFGKYSSSIQLKNDKIYYYRSLERYSGRFAASEYEQLAKFLDEVYKADRNRLVFVRNEAPSPKAF